MTQPTQSANDVLMGGGGGSPAWKFADPCTKTGTIKAPPQARQEREYDKDNPNGGALKFFPSGDPIMGVTVEVQTDERDGQDDDGARTFYIEGRYLREAVRDGVRAAGASGLEVGAKLTVQFTHREDPMDKRSRKFWQVTYTPAGNVALMATPPAHQAYQQPVQPGAGNATLVGQGVPHPPAGSFVQPPADVPSYAVQQAPAPYYPPQVPVQEAPTPQAAAEPVRPPAVPEVVWNTLTPAQKAETVAQLPGF